jgi:hypothetical protein
VFGENLNAQLSAHLCTHLRDGCMVVLALDVKSIPVDVKAILTPLCIYSLVMLYTKYT